MTARRPSAAPRPPHADGFHRAVRDELVRLSLGGRPDRPELQERMPKPTRTKKRRR